LSSTSYTYTGGVKKPTVTVKNANGTKLTTSSYTVTYASGRKNIGTYKVTIKMKGNYTGTKTLTFKIVPAKTTLGTLTAGTKKLTIKWTKKTTQVTGYQIQYSTSKSFKSYKTKTVSGYKTTSTSLTGLKAKTTYYVRVRTYKTVNGVKIYSAWSTIKYKKTK
ncbi:MAG: fibronectin type III domain-containing protein, partial [Clostridia bacterium]|nr:fibronectin type III domain-containing protein [Clostridia bacterium]